MPKKRAHIVMNWIHQQIQSAALLPGQRLPTEAQLCEKFNLSRSAVRNALHMLARQDSLQYEKNRGYFIPSVTSACAKPEPIKRQDLGLLCFFPGDYIFPDIITGFSSMLSSREYNIIIKQSEYQVEQERSALGEFLQQGISGLVAMPILTGEQAPNKDLYLKLIEKNVPIVFICSAVIGIESSSILTGDLRAGRRAAEIMLASGFHNFVLFYQRNYLTKAIRIQGAKEVLNAQRDVDYVELPFFDQGRHSDSRKKCVQFFQNFPREEQHLPMAWLCSSDEDAAIVIEVSRSYGWELHRDYELIGFDNSQLSELIGGGFSSFTVPGKLMGRMAARYLLDQMAELPGERHCIDVVVQSNFVDRNFCDFDRLNINWTMGEG